MHFAIQLALLYNPDQIRILHLVVDIYIYIYTHNIY